MLAANLQVCVEDIISITDKMLVACQDDEWEMLSRLQIIRQEQIERVFSDPSLLTSSVDVLMMLRDRLEKIDSKIIDLCHSESSDCKRQLRDNHVHRKGIVSYITCESSC